MHLQIQFSFLLVSQIFRDLFNTKPTNNFLVRRLCVCCGLTGETVKLPDQPPTLKHYSTSFLNFNTHTHNTHT